MANTCSKCEHWERWGGENYSRCKEIACVFFVDGTYIVRRQLGDDCTRVAPKVKGTFSCIYFRKAERHEADS